LWVNKQNPKRSRLFGARLQDVGLAACLTDNRVYVHGPKTRSTSNCLAAFRQVGAGSETRDMPHFTAGTGFILAIEVQTR
jgi:hypothetical protein